MSKIRLTKEFGFDAAHVLDRCGLPAGHKCTHLHGHTYRVVIGLEGDINPENGMLVDYADIAAMWAPLEKTLDHRFLNEIPGLRVSTTENLVHWIIQKLDGPAKKYVSDVRVYESATTYAEATVP